MKLNAKESQKLLGALPRGYAKKIAEEVQNSVKPRQIQNIIKGVSSDSHGIIEIATRIAKSKSLRRKKIMKTIDQL